MMIATRSVPPIEVGSVFSAIRYNGRYGRDNARGRVYEATPRQFRAVLVYGDGITEDVTFSYRLSQRNADNPWYVQAGTIITAP